MREVMWLSALAAMLIGGCTDASPESSAKSGDPIEERANPSGPMVGPGNDVEEPIEPPVSAASADSSDLGAPADPMVTTAESLLDDAKADPNMWNGKPVEVSGTVSNVGQEFPGQTFLTLAVSGELTGLICRFSDDPEPWATAVPGQEVTLRGTCRVPGGEPVVESSRFVKVGTGPGMTTSADLATSYAADRAGAWDSYRTKTLIVTGNVKSIEDRGSARVVILEGTNDADVECWFNSMNKDQVANLSVGDQAKVVGNLISSTDDEARDFPLSNCLLITRAPAQPT